MDKIEDSINTLEDLDEFTNYILNPVNQDSIIEVCDPTHVETEKLYVHISSSVKSVAFERMIDIVTGAIEYCEEDDSSNVEENNNVNLIKKNYTIIKDKTTLLEAHNHIGSSEFLTYDVESTGLNVRLDKVIGFAFCGKAGVAYYLPIYEYNKKSKELTKLNYLTDVDINTTLLKLKGKDLAMWNASYDIRITKNNLKVDLLDSLATDVMLMKHTIEEEGEFALKKVAAQYQKEIGLDIEKEANEEQLELKSNIELNGGSSTKTNYELYKADIDIIGKYACADVDLTFRLAELFMEKLKSEGLESFFFDEEVMPLYKEVTIPMEDRGIRLDMDLLLKTREDISKDIDEHKKIVLENLLSDSRVLEYVENLLDSLYPCKTSGKFAQHLVKMFNIQLPKTEKGTYSITKKTISDLPDSKFKEFFLYGNIELLGGDLIKSIQKSIHKETEDDIINILSKKQMGEISFDVLGYTPQSYTEKGLPQFDEHTINYLDSQGVLWASYLSDYNKLIKIRSTYIDRFLDAQEDGIFYPNFFQHRTISGRFGSDMQQLSRPKEEGQLRPTPLKYNNLIRKFFISRDRMVFIDDDYESLEPHVFAHVSGDSGLVDIFKKSHDFYSTIAIATEGLHEYSADKKADNYLGKVNKQKRQSAKSYSLGVPYGMTNYALSKTLDISKEEAQDLIDGYLNAYPNLKNWMKDSERQAKKLGYVSTESGRIRHLPKVKELYEKFGDDLLDFRKKNSLKKQYGDVIDSYYKEYKNGLNNAKNFQIQGLSASIVNRAAIEINRRFKISGIEGLVLLQIHDQLVMEVSSNKSKEAMEIVQDVMENNYKLSLRLKAVPQLAYNLMEGH